MDRATVRRHGSGRQPAHIRVVPARGGEEQNTFPRIIPNRLHQRDIRQMGAPIIRRIQHVSVTGFHGRILLDNRFDRGPHGAQMYRHMRRISDQIPNLVKHRAGEIQPLLDGDRGGRVFQNRAHLLGNGHIKVIEDLQHDRIGLRTDRMGIRTRRNPLEGHMIMGGDLGLPAGLNHD